MRLLLRTLKQTFHVYGQMIFIVGILNLNLIHSPVE